MNSKNTRRSTLIPLITVLLFISIGLLIAVVEKIQLPVKEVAVITEAQATNTNQVYIVKGQKSFYSTTPEGEKLNVFQAYQKFTDENVKKVYLGETVINYWLENNLKMNPKEEEDSFFKVNSTNPNVKIIEDGNVQFSNNVNIKFGSQTIQGVYQTLGKFEKTGLGWRYEVSNVDAKIGGCPLPGFNRFFFSLICKQYFEKKIIQDVAKKWQKIEKISVEDKFLIIEKTI